MMKFFFKFCCFAFLLQALLLAQVPLALAQMPLVFKHLTVENGLSSGSVLAITQDNKGFIWVGTMDGLNRYDGRSVKIFKSFYKDNLLGSGLKVDNLLADKEQNLWIGTNRGLYLYNTHMDSFRVFYASSGKDGLCHNVIRCLYPDSKGNILVGTQNGLTQIVPGKDLKFNCINIGYAESGLNFNHVQAIYEMQDGRVLLGTTSGLLVLKELPVDKRFEVQRLLLKGTSVTTIAEDKKHHTIWAGSSNQGVFAIQSNFSSVKQYTHQADESAGPVSNTVRKIKVDRNGSIWIGTLKGLSIFYPGKNLFEPYTHNPNDESTLNFNSIYDILEDKQGSIWVGTFFGGINIAEAISNPFKIFRNEENEKGLSSNIISSVIEDKKANLWIGTEAEGLNYFDRKAKTFKRFKNDEANANSLSSNLIKTLMRDKYDQVWVGMYGGGVNVMDASGKILKKMNAGSRSNPLNSDNVTRLMDDGKGRIWIGTQDDGINIYDEATGHIATFETIFPDKPLANKGITGFLKDSKQNIWIGTGGGLSMLQADEKLLTNFTKSTARGYLQSDMITSIKEDKKGLIWLGTHSGLSAYEPIKKQFNTYTVHDGLANDKVLGIIVDNHDNLWISTSNGLNFFDSARKRFLSFTVEDGLPGNVFNYNSYFKDAAGTIFFGGYKGLIAFDPADIRTNSTVPDIVLTGLSINGQPVNARDQTAILSKDISETAAIVLNYDQNVLTVDYAVLNFIKPGKNRSLYKLQGFDKDWRPSGSNSASYTNLPPGTYHLQVKGANNDGVWNETPATLKISILPPPWKTWWAYTLYVLAFLLLLSGIIYFFASRAALRRKLRYEHLVNVKQQELHQMKMDFFTHISHEIRTPLTLIMGPVEMLMMKTPAKSDNHKWLQAIRGNAERLLKLTTDLLEFRKADSGHTQLQIAPGDIVHFTRSVYDKFAEAATGKSINYLFETSVTTLEVHFDPHHMEIVLFNLLSNAIKFTPAEGTITVRLQQPKADEVAISVCDNGCGIPQQDQHKIFSHFYQADNVKTQNGGSGIGLAFSKNLVELHGGMLEFYSNPTSESGRQETCFTVTLKMGSNHINQSYLHRN